MKPTIVKGYIDKLKNRRVGVAYLSNGSWAIKGKSLVYNIGTGQKYPETHTLLLTSEAMRSMLTLFSEIVEELDLSYKPKEKNND